MPTDTATSTPTATSTDTATPTPTVTPTNTQTQTATPMTSGRVFIVAIHYDGTSNSEPDEICSIALQLHPLVGNGPSLNVTVRHIQRSPAPGISRLCPFHFFILYKIKIIQNNLPKLDALTAILPGIWARPGLIWAWFYGNAKTIRGGIGVLYRLPVLTVNPQISLPPTGRNRHRVQVSGVFPVWTVPQQARHPAS